MQSIWLFFRGKVSNFAIIANQEPQGWGWRVREKNAYFLWLSSFVELWWLLLVFL